MPNDLSIQAAAPASIGAGGVVPVKSAATAAPVEHATSLPSPSPNPTLELNAALGLVVIEFRNSAGAVTSSIPTAQQLEAYRLWQESGVGPAPNLGGSVKDAVAAPEPATSGGNSRSTYLGVGD
jgi:hypothetical protein